MNVVKVRAVREGRLWVLHLDDGGATQVRRLGEIDTMVSDYVSLMRDVPADSVQVELVEVDPGEDLTQAVTAAKAAQEAAAKAVETAAVLIRKAALELKGRGLTGVEVSHVLNVSPQRVSQLTAGGKAVRGAGGLRNTKRSPGIQVDATTPPTLTRSGEPAVRKRRR